MVCYDSVESQRGCCGKTSLRFGVAYIIFLNKIHEKEIATRTQKNLGFGVTVCRISRCCYWNISDRDICRRFIRNCVDNNWRLFKLCFGIADISII